MASETEHRGALDPYRTVVRYTPRAKRPIYGTRYLVTCSCGWDTDAADYIFAKRSFRRHLDDQTTERRE